MLFKLRFMKIKRKITQLEQFERTNFISVTFFVLQIIFSTYQQNQYFPEKVALCKISTVKK